MKNLFLSTLLAACIAALAPEPAAQGQLHFVDASGACSTAFPEISGAVQAAASGDTIVVKSGSYQPFTIDGKSLTITADAGASVKVTTGATSINKNAIHVKGLTDGQRVVLRGLVARTKILDRHALFVDQGLLEPGQKSFVWVEDCTLKTLPATGPAMHGVTAEPTVRLTNGTAGTVEVLFEGSTLLGRDTPDPSVDQARPALVADGCELAFHGCSVEGGSGADGDLLFWDGTDGATAAVVSGSASNLVYSAGSSFRGGDGGDGLLVLGVCSKGGHGGHGLELLGPTLNAMTPDGDPSCSGIQCQFAGGEGGAGQLCGSGADGVPVSGSFVLLTGDPRSLTAASPVENGGQDDLAYEGLAGDILFLFYTADPGLTLVPAWSSVQIAGIYANESGVADAQGEFAWTPTVNMGGTADAVTVYLQVLATQDGASFFLSSATALTHIRENCP